MKKRTAIFAGIIAMLAVVTSVGLTAVLTKPVHRKIKPGRVKYLTVKPYSSDKFKTMLPGAKFRPIPEFGYIIIGKKIILQKPKPEEEKFIITGKKITVIPAPRKYLERCMKKLFTRVVPVVKEVEGEGMMIKPIQRSPRFR